MCAKGFASGLRCPFLAPQFSSVPLNARKWTILHRLRTEEGPKSLSNPTLCSAINDGPFMLGRRDLAVVAGWLWTQHKMVSYRAQADESNAYIPDGPYIEGSPTGPLRGLTFAVKDLFDVRCPLLFYVKSM